MILFNKKYMTHSFLLIGALGLSACSIFDSTPDKKPLAGERISILDLDQELRPQQSAVLNGTVTISEPITNPDWSQNGGNASHVLGNLSLGNSAQLERIWSADIGSGAQKRLPLTAQPIIADGKVFTLDTESIVKAFHDQTGKTLWSASVQHQTEDEPVIGGGLSYGGGVLYVTSGYNEVLALNPQNGQLYWRTKISAGSRAAPTVHNGRVFITALNNNVIALDATSGAALWEYEGVGETTGLLGAASPAADDVMVIPALSSGDLLALRVENGSTIWNDSLANSLRLGGMAGLSDIRGLPIIHNGMVIAVSFGGKMVAFDQRNGVRIWQQEISSAETPWVSGNSLFVLSSDYKLMAINIANGEIIWVSNIDKYEKPENRKGLIAWAGPVMAGGRLILSGTHGKITEFNPADGIKLGEIDVNKEIHLAPVIANGTLYLLSEDGSLLAYK